MTDDRLADSVPTFKAALHAILANIRAGCRRRKNTRMVRKRRKRC